MFYIENNEIVINQDKRQLRITKDEESALIFNAEHIEEELGGLLLIDFFIKKSSFLNSYLQGLLSNDDEIKSYDTVSKSSIGIKKVDDKYIIILEAPKDNDKSKISVKISSSNSRYNIFNNIFDRIKVHIESDEYVKMQTKVANEIMSKEKRLIME